MNRTKYDIQKVKVKKKVSFSIYGLELTLMINYKRTTKNNAFIMLLLQNEIE